MKSDKQKMFEDLLLYGFCAHDDKGNYVKAEKIIELTTTKPDQMCEKRGYTTEREANTVINSAKKNRYNNRRSAKIIPKRAYKCDICGLYHLTSKANRYDN